jgi:hypothetical protein
LATSRHGFTGEDLCKSGFACAILTDKADTVAVVDPNRHIFD